MGRRQTVVVAGILLGLVSVGGGPAVVAAEDAADDDQARAWCTEVGGTLVDRVATWNTNGDPSSWVPLGRTWTLCEFEMTEGDQVTRISVDLVTLASETFTLAGSAYLAKLPPILPEQPGANPATANCTALGGTSVFGQDASGGGWVNAEEPVFTVMSLCVFADGSAIDEWGITYYATGAVRGADLATKMRSQATLGRS